MRWPAAPTCWRKLGRREDALADARALVAAHPRRSAGDWFNLGFPARGRPIVSTKPRRRSAARVELDPKLDRAWYGLGLALIRQRRFDEAVAALKRNTELQPMSPYGWYQLARVHMDRHEPEEARKIIRHLKGSSPRWPRNSSARPGLAAMTLGGTAGTSWQCRRDPRRSEKGRAA